MIKSDCFTLVSTRHGEILVPKIFNQPEEIREKWEDGYPTFFLFPNFFKFSIHLRPKDLVNNRLLTGGWSLRQTIVSALHKKTNTNVGVGSYRLIIL